MGHKRAHAECLGDLVRGAGDRLDGSPAVVTHLASGAALQLHEQRGGAPDLGAAHAGAGGAVPVRRRAPAVRIGVEARGRLADDPGHAQHRDRGPGRGIRSRVPRLRYHGGRSGLPGRVRGRQGQQGQGGRGRGPQAAGDEARRPDPARPHPRRPALHPAAAALHRSLAGQGARREVRRYCRCSDDDGGNADGGRWC